MAHRTCIYTTQPQFFQIAGEESSLTSRRRRPVATYPHAQAGKKKNRSTSHDTAALTPTSLVTPFLMPRLDRPTLLHGDCLELMKLIPDGVVDMSFADLPYGTTRCACDSRIDLDYFWRQNDRVLKRDGAALFTAQIPFSIILGASNLNNLKYGMIWEKTNVTAFFSG